MGSDCFQKIRNKKLPALIKAIKANESVIYLNIFIKYDYNIPIYNYYSSHLYCKFTLKFMYLADTNKLNKPEGARRITKM